MIFLFFGSSIAHLEPELQPFEDRSIFFGISATWAGFGYEYIPTSPQIVANMVRKTPALILELCHKSPFPHKNIAVDIELSSLLP